MEILVFENINRNKIVCIFQGQLVYVNYGRREDFQWLLDHSTINFTGKFCIARYGKVGRFMKVKNRKTVHKQDSGFHLQNVVCLQAKFGEEHGCSGVILYSDPADYAHPGGAVYPDGWFMPETGVQRGSLMIAGDPLTPGYPSIGW